MDKNSPGPNIKGQTSSRKKRVKGWALGLLGLLVLLLIPGISLKRYSDDLTRIPDASPSQKADCGVVLTGGSGRVREGITLLSHRQVKKLIISGVHQHSTLADMFPEILFYPEVNLEDVILERRSSSTAGNAQQSLILVEALQCKSVLLVTSDYHILRSLKTFSVIFPATIQLFAYPVNSDRLHERPIWPLDTRYWGTVFEEWAKYLFYELTVF